MMLENYLLKLALPDKDRSIREQIYLRNLNTEFEEIYKIIKKNTKRGKLIKLVCSALKYPKPTIDSWRNGHNHIPILKLYNLLLLWRKVCKKSKQEFNDKWYEIFQKVNEFSSRGKQSVILPKILNEEVAYLCGFIIGDGYVKDEIKLKGLGKDKEYSISMYDASRKFADFLSFLFLKNYNVNCNIYFAKDEIGSWYTIRCSSKPIYRFFTQVIGITLGKDTGNTQVPKSIKNSTDEIKNAFVSGFFDAETGVGITKKGYWLEIAQISYHDSKPKILLWIKRFLKKYDINLKGPTQMTENKKAWRLRCSNKSTISKFYNIISSKHMDKIPVYEKINEKVIR